ncbi:MAG TPA: 30S ribosomal protein S11 [Thermoanaerobaculia bacterium]|jgi:small subunit ribosomal protein S11|nr:30S ribosomal protein S11 [Thermoanaerobaculia bacterium]
MAEPATTTPAAPEKAPAKKGRKPRGGKKEKKNVPHAVATVQASFNNTIIAIADQEGNVLAWSSAGRIGFKGSRKGTPFAAQLAAANCAEHAKENGVRSVDVRVNGPGAGRESAIRALQANGIDIKSIKDTTPIPHNGCRPRKRRRV